MDCSARQGDADMNYKKRLGRFGETFAVNVLEEKGFVILEENYRGRYGEIDIIAKKGTTIHFIEVKTRYGDNCGMPAEAVDNVKLGRISATAEEYIRRKRPGWRDLSFDVFEIQADIIWDIS